MKVLKIILLCHYSKKYIESFGFGWRNPLSGQNNLLFSLALCDIFSIGIPNASRRDCEELRGIYSFSFLTVPCRHFFSKFSPFFLHVSILLPNYTIATIYMWSIPHLVDLQIENIRRFAFHVFLPLVVDHMYVVADEEVRSAFFRTLSSTAPDGIIHWALSFCSRLLLMWSSMMRLRRILPVVGQNAVKEM